MPSHISTNTHSSMPPMAQRLPQQQTLPSTTEDENPVVAFGRKIKSVFSSHQRPSIRIQRGLSSTTVTVPLPRSEDVSEKPNRRNASFANRFAAIRSLFAPDNDSANDRSYDDCDLDTDLLDVVGECGRCDPVTCKLIFRRPRSSYTLHLDERPKLPLRSFGR